MTQRPNATVTRGTVLVGEFEQAFSEILTSLLDSWGHSVLLAENARDRWDMVTTYAPDLLLLPMNHRDVRPRGFLDELRTRGDATGVIVVGGPGDAAHKIDALKMGADDYLSRPFDFAELAARVQAILRRSSLRVLVRFGGRLTVDPASHQIIVDGRAMLLPPRQFSLVWILTSLPGRHTTTAEITRAVWGADSAGARAELYVLIGGLRRQLGALGTALTVATITGRGYAITFDGSGRRRGGAKTATKGELRGSHSL